MTHSAESVGVDTASKLAMSPITLKEAGAYVSRLHRHHRAPHGALFAIAAVKGDEIVGVAIIGRPVGRGLQDGYTCEVVRLCTDGTRNACSYLYGKSWRAAQALGYRRMVTYTLPEEGGASLRAAGWKLIGPAGGGTWNRPNSGRPRVDLHPTQEKLRWEVAA